jgi:hypothetical protein
MKIFTKEQISKILDDHSKWLDDSDTGKRANFRDTNLSGANLYGANLYGANLYGANLRDANLYGANLRDANLYGANLRDADFRGADLYVADLYGADLRGANLHGANLYGANLRGANLHGANLRDADLRGANLSGANLRDANLSGAKTDQRFIMIGCIGSRKAMITYCFDNDHIWCGCWSGSLDDFEIRVKDVNADNPQYIAEYIGAINYIKSLKNTSNNEHPSTINHPSGREEYM